jgi:hypothetical protein
MRHAITGAAIFAAYLTAHYNPKIVPLLPPTVHF